MQKKQVVYRVTVGMFFGALALYLSFPAARYNFDGVACAIAVELGRFRNLLHGNHLLYGFLGRLFYDIFQLYSIPLPAVHCLQILSSLLSAGAVAAIPLILMECGVEWPLAVAGAAGVAISRIFWVWSLEAQVYPLGAIFLFWAAYEAFRKKPNPWLLGLLHAGAVLGHVGHFVFFPVVLYLLPGKKERLRYGAVLSGVVLASYAAAGLLVIQPSSWNEFKVWILGSAAISPNRGFLWHGGYSVLGLWTWIKVSFEMASGTVLGGVLLLGAASAGAWKNWKSNRRVVGACLIWIASYSVLYLSWEPNTAVYRITDLLPLWVLAVLAVERLPLKRAERTAVAAGCVVILGAWNWAREIMPFSDSAKNRDLQRAIWISNQTPEQAWMVVDGIDQVYVPYFAHRRTLNLNYFHQDDSLLAQRVDALAKTGEPAYVILPSIPEAWRPRIPRNIRRLPPAPIDN